MDLEFILQKNLKDISAFYVRTVRHIIEKNKVPLEDLHACLLSLTTSSEVSKLTLMADKEEQLKECTTIIDIFDFLITKCASFLNYEIFEDILKYYKFVMIMRD